MDEYCPISSLDYILNRSCSKFCTWNYIRKKCRIRDISYIWLLPPLGFPGGTYGNFPGTVVESGYTKTAVECHSSISIVVGNLKVRLVHS